ncbi:MAG TPA: molybdopterin-dependent oxidoreductase [Bryobacteraceae bacterium]|nr:molybdopterin-dependent oxidoreductase [Bryobacteraceae bacterium]
MERRSFFKIVGTASGGLLTGACGKQAREIIPLLVPEKEIVAGEEEWHPSVCRECSAGCGTVVRVMQAEREVVRGKEKVREKIAAIKKIEGNPLDAVSGGRLCARGQAAVEALYHPDRVRGPMKRSGKRGEGRFESLGWDAALESAAELFRKAAEKDPGGIVWLGRAEAGSRAAAIAVFLDAFKAPAASTVGLCDFEIERKAAEIVFDWKGLPVYEIQDADYVLGLGADFLGGWVSPVFYARRFGHMRRGRPGRRGRLAQAESRFSVTASSADEWLPVQPGGEVALALAIGRVLVDEKLAAAAKAAPELREGFASADFERGAKIAGIPGEQIRRVARELGSAETAVVVAGASIVQANSLEAVVAASALNLLLGNVGRSVQPAADAGYEAHRPRYEDLEKRLEHAELVVLDGANPAYARPGTAKLLAKAPAVISFSGFIDDSAAYADLVLPDHAALESDAVIEPAVAPGRALAGARPFVRPLYDTRATADLLVEIAKKLGKTIAKELPEDAYKKLFAAHKPVGEWRDAEEFAAHCERQGGWWAESEGARAGAARFALPKLSEPVVQGSGAEFPLQFQPYPSLQFGDGSGAHLPWMQELPDPASSAMWGLPVEIDPRTAAKLGVKNGDVVRVISANGRIEAPAYVHPAAIPGVVSMGIGQGHTHYGRYASGRGANPLAIVAALHEPQTGVPAFGGTRVRIEKTGAEGALVQFSAVDREPEIRRR